MASNKTNQTSSRSLHSSDRFSSLKRAMSSNPRLISSNLETLNPLTEIKKRDLSTSESLSLITRIKFTSIKKAKSDLSSRTVSLRKQINYYK